MKIARLLQFLLLIAGFVGIRFMLHAADGGMGRGLKSYVRQESLDEDYTDGAGSVETLSDRDTASFGSPSPSLSEALAGSPTALIDMDSSDIEEIFRQGFERLMDQPYRSDVFDKDQKNVALVATWIKYSPKVLPDVMKDFLAAVERWFDVGEKGYTASEVKVFNYLRAVFYGKRGESKAKAAYATAPLYELMKREFSDAEFALLTPQSIAQIILRMELPPHKPMTYGRYIQLLTKFLNKKYDEIQDKRRFGIARFAAD